MRRLTRLLALALLVSSGAASPVLAAGGSLASGDRLPGILAGVVLAALVIYALIVSARPLIGARDSGLKPVLLALLTLWIVKTIAVVFCPGFSVDVGTFEAWGLDIAQHGPAAMYRTGSFLDYPPGYLYALWGGGALANWLGASGAALRVLIETPALAADFALSSLIFILVRRRASLLSALLATAFVALNPALLFDTVLWGQSDSALALVMLLSLAMLLDDEFELGWGLAALALLIKPQAIMLMPVLGLWTLRTAAFRRWWRAALAFFAVVIIGAAPFQMSHPWSWLPELYLSTAAYYHETSVNAFNLMALLGGLRQNDSTAFLGLSFFELGIALVAAMYAVIGIALWREPSRRNLWIMSFLALFGFFLLAPRMHERYIYPAIVFAIPLALEEPAMLGVFALLTVTGLVNLAYVLHTLNTVVFLDAHDAAAMAVAMLNCAAFVAAAIYGFAPARSFANGSGFIAGAEQNAGPRLAAVFDSAKSRWRAAAPEKWLPFAWTHADTAALLILTGAAAALRFWRLGHPAEIVFDEVHFVGQARHYLHNEPFLDPHPPIAKLVIAAGIYLFGDHSWSWRLGNAIIGTALVAITYLLGRRMFRSRLAAGIAAALIAGDGFFIVDSRIGCIDIVYVTFAALTYLFLFDFIQASTLTRRRLLLIPLGVVLGLCLGSKLYVPGVTFLLAMGFIAFTLWRPDAQPAPDCHASSKTALTAVAMRRTVGALLMTGAIATIFYLASFAPHYLLGWWGGIADLFHYYKDVMWYEKSVSTATHPYASPWWSWPLMLRPVAYWQDFPPKGNVVATIWGAGNPLTWWAVISAISIIAVRLFERPNLTYAFLLIGYLAYYVVWIPIGRILFLYHYLPSVYIGYLALGLVLGDLWRGDAEPWEGVAILLPVLTASVVGLGHIANEYKPDWLPVALRSSAGLPLAAVIALGYLALLRDHRNALRFAAAVFTVASILMFVYYLPIWLGTPISRTGYYARMWFEGPGLRNWI